MSTTFYMSAVRAYTNWEEFHADAQKFDWVHRGSVMVWGEDYSRRMAKHDFNKWKNTYNHKAEIEKFLAARAGVSQEREEVAA